MVLGANLYYGRERCKQTAIDLVDSRIVPENV
jgi:hypothetical protein